MIARWPGGGSYTGQALAEIHVIGSPPVLQAVLGTVLGRGARPAGPGEFTLRAFLSGRLDLTQAESVAALIEARNAGQLDRALRQLAGGLAGPIGRLRDRLLDLLAHLEAGLDFVDEEDVDPLARSALADELAVAAGELATLAATLGSRSVSDELQRVVLAGPPNSGKSSLFNALLREDRALVSSVAGTTRDYVEAPFRLDGVWAILVDTAGLEEAATSIDAQAQSQRAGQHAAADLLLCCQAADQPTPADPRGDGYSIGLITKADLLEMPAPEGCLPVSSASEQGLDELRARISERLRERASEADPTAARCRDALARASVALGDASEAVSEGLGDELVAIELRQALDDLGRVVGAVVTDDILDRIFSRFCIGK
jgi:tRNA modification GTPase